MSIDPRTVRQIKMAAEQGLTQAEASRLLDMNQSYIARAKALYNIKFIMHEDKYAHFRSPQDDIEINENELVDDRGHEEPRPDQGQEILQVVFRRAANLDGIDGVETEKPPKTIQELKERLKQNDKQHHYEIIYSFKLQEFEKQQIKLGLRTALHKTRKIQSLSTSSANKNIALNSQSFPAKHEIAKQQRILKSINRGGRYTTSMIARNTGLSVSYVAPQLNVLFNQGLVLRSNEKQPPFIGAIDGKKTFRYVYFKKNDE